MAIFRQLFLYSSLLIIGLFIWPNFCFGADKDVVINEIAWMGTEVDGIDSKDWWRYEWLELYNNTDQSISLEGWKIELYRTALDWSLELKGNIPAQSYFLIVASDKISPNYDLNYSNLGGKFNNDGQKIFLKDHLSNIIDEVDCFSSKKWFTGDNTTKQTMERKNPQDSGNDPSNWQDSQQANGTPRAQNSASVEAPYQGQPEEVPPITSEGLSPTNQPPKANAGSDVVALTDQEITFDGSLSSDPENDPLSYFWNFGDGTTAKEIKPKHIYQYPSVYIVTLTVSDGKNSNTAIIKASIYSRAIIISEFIPNPEGKDEENEWIEIHNQSDKIADLSGWQIKDSSSQKAFIFPEQSLIDSKQYLVIKRSTSKISLNNDQDTLSLLYPTGDTCQEIKYEKAKEGYSVNFVSSNQYVWSSSPSPGMPNIITTPESKQKTSETKFLEPLSQVTEPKKEFSLSYPLMSLTLSVTPLEVKSSRLLNLLPQPVIAQVTEPTSQQISEISFKGKNENQKIISGISGSLSAVISDRINRGFSDFILIIIIIISAGLVGIWLTRLRRTKKQSL